MGLVGYLDRYIAWYMRLGLFLAGLFVVSSNYLTTALGLLLAAAIVLYERDATHGMEKPELKQHTHVHRPFCRSLAGRAPPFSGAARSISSGEGRVPRPGRGVSLERRARVVHTKCGPTAAR